MDKANLQLVTRERKRERERDRLFSFNSFVHETVGEREDCHAPVTRLINFRPVTER